MVAQQDEGKEDLAYASLNPMVISAITISHAPLMYIPIMFNNVDVRAMIDTSATNVFVSERLGTG